jgi:tripartite-type tricarboxylate transporter receptor subunit TctC
VDTTTRLVLRFAPNHLPGARFVAVNRPGAGGQLGYEAAFNAPADGWTLCAVTAPAMPAMPIERAVRYRPLGWTFFANVVDDPNAFYVAAGSRLRTLADLAAAARERPAGLSYGSTGVGGDDHIAMLAFEALSGIPPMVHAPFAGNAPAMQALLGGHLALLVGNIGESLSLLREGQLRCLGVAAPARMPQAADAPTFREQGFDLVSGASRGLVGPPGMPAPVRARLERPSPPRCPTPPSCRKRSGWACRCARCSGRSTAECWPRWTLRYAASGNAGLGGKGSGPDRSRASPNGSALC